MSPERQGIAGRPLATTTMVTRWVDKFDRLGSPPLGVRKVLVQLGWDLFGTKDVQDPITATYVWAADQLGHVTLGLVPALLSGWAVRALRPQLGLPEWGTNLAIVIVALAVLGLWFGKELWDLRTSIARLQGVFPPDTADLVWNVKTALLYFGIGTALGCAAWIGPGVWAIAIVLAVVAAPALCTAFWWLRRKLAFQQASVLYLCRLANWGGSLKTNQPGIRVTDEISKLVSRTKRTTRLDGGARDTDPKPSLEPIYQHFLIAGPVGIGKTSLVTAIGTEYAFRLGRCRYMSAVDLVEKNNCPDPSPSAEAAELDLDDGRMLWKLNDVDLLIVDDIDAAAAVGADSGKVTQLVEPQTLGRTLTASGVAAPLRWLGGRQSIWVVGSPEQSAEWVAVIAGLMDVRPDAILTLEVAAT